MLLFAAANTNAVVASCVVFVPGAAVGAVGVPVSAGLASGAYGGHPVPSARQWASCALLAVL